VKEGSCCCRGLEVCYLVCVFFLALELDKNRVIETAPLSFRTLLGVLGIEAALECLIKMLCTENN
jgi:hypothetical protein